jgi:hypothetical protein
MVPNEYDRCVNNAKVMNLCILDKEIIKKFNRIHKISPVELRFIKLHKREKSTIFATCLTPTTLSCH